MQAAARKAAAMVAGAQQQRRRRLCLLLVQPSPTPLASTARKMTTTTATRRRRRRIAAADFCRHRPIALAEDIAAIAVAKDRLSACAQRRQQQHRHFATTNSAAAAAAASTYPSSYYYYYYHHHISSPSPFSSQCTSSKKRGRCRSLTTEAANIVTATKAGDGASAGAGESRNNNASATDHSITDDGGNNEDCAVLEKRYLDLVRAADKRSDPHQLSALQPLEVLRRELLLEKPQQQQQHERSSNRDQNRAAAATKKEKKAKKAATWWSSASAWVNHGIAKNNNNDNNSNKESSSASLSPSWRFEGGLFRAFDFDEWVVNPKAAANTSIRGVYLHGGVGCGKTFLMKLFYDSLLVQQQQQQQQQSNKKSGVDNNNSSADNDLAPPPKAAKTLLPWRRLRMTHFHEFMLRIHQLIHEARYNTKNNNGGDDLLQDVVDEVTRNGRRPLLLCLDEFQVTDVADAMVLRQLFEKLWACGSVLVATSNRSPDGLYKNGVQRDRFLPFIELLKQKCIVHDMTGSETDYRMVAKSMPTAAAATSSNTKENNIGNLSASKYPPPQVFYCCGTNSNNDNDTTTSSAFEERFAAETAGYDVGPVDLQVAPGRTLRIPAATGFNRSYAGTVPPGGGVCRFSFADLCQTAAGAADYLSVADHYSTVFVSDVPTLTLAEINWVRRFITFVDSLYVYHVQLIVGTVDGGAGGPAATTPDGIFVKPTQAAEHHDEAFAFDRTASRLHEMQSAKYLQQPWTGRSGD